MSMTGCERCDRLIDRDDDPECFVTIIERGPDGEHPRDGILCEVCRDREWRKYEPED